MSDTVSKLKRSQIMAAVRSKGNKATELKLISIFRGNKIYGWRRNVNLPGRPDFVFKRERLVVFVDGCFWHGCKLHCRLPQTNCQYWQNKIARNMARDKRITKSLEGDGWGVLRIWEHSLRVSTKVAKVIKSRLSTKD